MFKKMCISLGMILGVACSGSVSAQVCGDGGQGYTDPETKQMSCNGGSQGNRVYGTHPRDGLGPLPVDNGGGNAPNNSGGGGNKRVAPKIVDMYGAVALNNDASAFGYSANQSSKSSAAFEAIKSCAQSGCKVVATYANQCAAFAWGKTARAGITRFAGASTKEVAEANVLKACNQKANNCQILMSECSVVGK
jgi:hypothetical protein